MNHSSNIFYLHFSNLLLLPLIGALFCKFQIFLIKKGLMHHVLLGHTDYTLERNLLSSFPKDAVIFCSVPFIGRALRYTHAKVIFDATIHEPKRLSLSKLHALMWTLVFSAAVTPRAKEN